MPSLGTLIAAAVTGLAASVATPARGAVPATTPAPRVMPLLIGSEAVEPFTRRTSVLALAQKYGTSPQTIRRLNRLDKRTRKQLKQTTHILISSRAISPRPFDNGVVINLPAFRLFLLKDGAVAKSWPVALGRDFDKAWQNKTRWRTPIGQFRIVGKYWHADWIVPKDLQKELKTPRERVPYGDPEYPLGPAKIALTYTGLNIHGTYAPMSIGRLASHGCIRMWNPAVVDLYKSVKVGTPVALAYAPVQVTENAGRVWLEVNPDVYHMAGDLADRARIVISGSGLQDRVDPYLVAKTVAAMPGVAVDVTRAAPPAGPATIAAATDTVRVVTPQPIRPAPPARPTAPPAMRMSAPASPSLSDPPAP
ncbi:MAG: L,D-transpeptidase [Candidatus Sericytochromatia bacterium]|uniref:L,D-transpeptidase n=1 Tax=Candidatus Tanganyikabacteria bacterium TaxID=2961651 RepID=A0A937X1E8_9BACT|nr:L,D-transpeptidase [Candidatus Tanganyikabacteria bacterium]